MEIKLPNSNYLCKTLIDIIRYRTESKPNKMIYTFLVDGENSLERITFAELDKKAKSIAAALQKNKIAQNQRALLIYPPGLDFIAAFFGCLYAGVLAVPTYPPLNVRYLEKLLTIIKDCDPVIFLSTTEFMTQFQNFKLDGINKIQCITTDDVQCSDSEFLNHTLLANQTAFIQYTSGSTSNPKGVMISHQNLLQNFDVQYRGFGFNADDIMGSWLPPYHDMGLIGTILQPLYSNIPSYLMSPYHFLQKPLRWLQLIIHFKVTVSGGPNFSYEYCTKKITHEQKNNLDLSCWEIAFNGAEPVCEKTMEQFYEAFKLFGLKKESLYPCYGLAEATLYVSSGERKKEFKRYHVNSRELRNNTVQSSFKSNDQEMTIVSCGKPWHPLVIVDPKNRTVCKENEIGEIWITSPSVANCYWNNEVESKETFEAQISKDNSKKYLRTGDLGFLNKGELYITGRLKDVIILYGVNHFLQDIENTVIDAPP